MGIKILKNGSGEFCRVWFGRLTRNGRKVDRSLDVSIRGEIPTNEAGQWDRGAKGDAAFEKSKAEALEAFAALVRGEGNQRKKIKAHETALLALTGQEADKTPLGSLGAKWCAMQRDRQPTKQRADAAKATFANFAAFADTFASGHGHRCAYLEEVTPEMAKAYFAKLTASLAWGTVKDKYGLLRNAWRRWSKTSKRTNPFSEIVMRKGAKSSGRISRVPLTAEEARRLFEIVEEKRPSLFPLLACAATTGLRLGDAVSLKWSDVHIERNVEEVRRGNFGTIGKPTAALETKKTGARVIVPIIQPFADVLFDMDKRRDDRDIYLFPEMLARYQGKGTRSGLIREVKPFFALAVMKDPEKIAAEREAEEVCADGDGKTAKLDEILEAVEGANFTAAKKSRIVSILKAHFAGVASHFIAEDLGLARSQVSEYLRDAEDLAGVALRTSTKRRRKLDLKVDRRSLIDQTRRGKPNGKRKDGQPVRKNAASIYGWHSLRATYVVLAVEAGVPLPFVEKAVGHSTVEMTLQYFNPKGQHVAEVMGRKLARTFARSRVGVADAVEIGKAEKTSNALPIAKLTAENVLDAMSDEEKKKLRRRLLEEAGMI